MCACVVSLLIAVVNFSEKIQPFMCGRDPMLSADVYMRVTLWTSNPISVGKLMMSAILDGQDVDCNSPVARCNVLLLIFLKL